MSTEDLLLGIGVIAAALVVLFVTARNAGRNTSDCGGGATTDADSDGGGGDGGGD